MRAKIFLSILLSLILASSTLGAVNINTADFEELQTLVGIGPALAARIIDYRETNGRFSKIEDIMKVTGIKEGIFNNLKSFITVGGAGETAGDEDQKEVFADTATTESISSHSGARDLTDVVEAEEVKIGIGRARIVAVHTPVEFEILATKKLPERARVSWSFGDGSGKRGLKATHEYNAPGNYVVVATLDQESNQVTARTSVLVFVPEIQLAPSSYLPDGICLTNKSKYEINLGRWSLADDRNSFLIAPETIISPGATITITPETKEPLKIWGIRLLYPNGLTAAVWMPTATVIAPNPKPVSLVAASRAIPITVATSTNVILPTTTTIVLTKPTGFWQKSVIILKQIFQ